MAKQGREDDKRPAAAPELNQADEPPVKMEAQKKRAAEPPVLSRAEQERLRQKLKAKFH